MEINLFYLCKTNDTFPPKGGDTIDMALISQQ